MLSNNDISSELVLVMLWKRLLSFLKLTAKDKHVCTATMM